MPCRRNAGSGASVPEDPEFRSRFVKGYDDVRLTIFSGSGFTDELLEIGESRDDLEPVSLDGLFSGWGRRKPTSLPGAGRGAIGARVGNILWYSS